MHGLTLRKQFRKGELEGMMGGKSSMGSAAWEIKQLPGMLLMRIEGNRMPEGWVFGMLPTKVNSPVTLALHAKLCSQRFQSRTEALQALRVTVAASSENPEES